MRTRSGVRRCGVTLVELVGAVTILVVGVLSLAGVIVAGTRLSVDNRDNALIAVAHRNVLARLHAEDFPTLSREFGTRSPRPWFWCTETGSITFADPGDALITGTIEFFDNENDIPAEFGAIGGSFDLDSDGSIENERVASYVILPVRIRLTVTGTNGTRTLTRLHVLSPRPSW